jgi:hypothetical protein
MKDIATNEGAIRDLLGQWAIEWESTCVIETVRRHRLDSL